MTNCPLLKGVDENECHAMLDCFGARTKDYRAGDIVYDTDEWERREIGVLRSGSITVERIDYSGSRSILERITAGGIFGRDIAFSENRAEYLFVCEEDAEVIYVSYLHIITPCSNVCQCHKQITENMLEILTDKARELSKRVEVLAHRTIREKLLCYISQLAHERGRGSFTLPNTLTAVADYICVDRSAMMREISKLRSEGIMDISKGRVRFYMT